MLAHALLRNWAHEFEVECPTGPALRLVRARSPLPIYGRVLSPEDADRGRNLMCSSYNDCLHFAERNDWPGFVCTSCTAYTPIDRDQMFRDLDAITDMMARMAQVAFSPEERVRMGLVIVIEEDK